MTTLALIPAATSVSCPHPLRAGPPLDATAFAAIRSALVLEHCKWDPQIGDVSTLAPFPLLLVASEWARLAAYAEALAAEALAAEEELIRRPELHKTLGISWRIRRVLANAADAPRVPVPARTMRFDFHWTATGWQISEVNSDVPGGYAEASAFPALLSVHYPGTTTAGDPAGAWADALAQNTLGPDPVALLAATGLMEDQQIMAYLARLLADRGCPSLLADPAQVRWHHGRAVVVCGRRPVPVAALVRFFQVEWLPHLPWGTPWRHFFTGSTTPISNPGTSILTESKRFPLVWPELSTPLPTWQSLLPETRDPRHAPWASNETWLVKSAFCNTGETVAVRGLVGRRDWRSVTRSVRWYPRHWIAQRRFDTLPVDTPAGPQYPCVGVYVINGKAAGIYARISPRPVIDFSATDVAVLITPDEPASARPSP